MIHSLDQLGNRRVVSLISLGCAKNIVDSELILGRFAECGWLIAENPSDSDLCLVNTCGFIQAARKEVADVLQELHELKTESTKQIILHLVVLSNALPTTSNWNTFFSEWMH